MGDVEGENYDSLLRNLTNANTMLLNDASETLEFNSIDALDQVCLELFLVSKKYRLFRALEPCTRSPASL